MMAFVKRLFLVKLARSRGKKCDLHLHTYLKKVGEKIHNVKYGEGSKKLFHFVPSNLFCLLLPRCPPSPLYNPSFLFTSIVFLWMKLG